MHPELNAFFPPQDGFTTEVDILVAIIENVRERSEPHCQGVLNKLAEDTRRKQYVNLYQDCRFLPLLSMSVPLQASRKFQCRRILSIWSTSKRF